MTAWEPKRGKSGWRNFLTAEELTLITDAERQRQSARQKLAEATAIIAPIQNRAIQRAKHATSMTKPTPRSAAISQGRGNG